MTDNRDDHQQQHIITCYTVAHIIYYNTLSEQTTNDYSPCNVLLILQEQGTQSRTITECEGGPRESHVIVSKTEAVELTVLSRVATDVYFLLQYECEYAHILTQTYHCLQNIIKIRDDVDCSLFSLLSYKIIRHTQA